MQIWAIWIFKWKDLPGKGMLQEIHPAFFGGWLVTQVLPHSTHLPVLHSQATPRSDTEGKQMGAANYVYLQQEGAWEQEKTFGFSTCSIKQEAMYLMPRLIAPNSSLVLRVTSDLPLP